MLRSRLLRTTAVTAIGVLLTLNVMFARLQHQTEDTQRRVQTSDESRLRLPSARLLRVVFGGFDPLAADIVWIWSLVYYGEQRSQNHDPRYLEEYARTIAELDPYFHPVYRWFSATYIRTNHPPSHEDIELVNQFLERGMRYFPTDYRLPQTAGLNYIGYSSDRSPRIRLREIAKAIEYLQRASQYEGALDTLPFTVAWLYQRKREIERQIEGDGESESSSRASKTRQAEFFTDMYYLVDSESARRRIRKKLSRLGREEAILERGTRYRQTLKREHSHTFSYVPLNLWTLVATPPQ